MSRVPLNSSGICAINRSSNAHSGTCFYKTELRLLAKHLGLQVKVSASKEELLAILSHSKTLNGIPQTQWVNTVLKKTSSECFKTMVFKPTLLKKGTWSWLNDDDIMKLMKQYQVYYNKSKSNAKTKSNRSPFCFYGVFPSDYFKLSKGRKEIKPIQKLVAKGTKVGIVFNLDPSHLPGSHWVAVYLGKNLHGTTVEYFDSYGDKPTKDIREFLESFGEPTVNRVQHQRKNGVCGVYAINFLLSRLYGVSFESYTHKLVPDDQVNALRTNYFAVNIN